MAIDYALVAAASKIIERIIFAVGREVPEVAPSVLFREHDDTTCTLDQVTEPDRLRRFEVTLESPERGEDDDGNSKLAYAPRFVLRVGYCVGSHEWIGDVSYKRVDLVAHDLEQLDSVIRSEAIFGTIDADHPAIDDFVITKLEGQRDRRRVVETVYQIEYKRTR